MQLDLLVLLAPPPPAEGWVSACPGRWVRYDHPHRLLVQQDAPGGIWRWSCHRWPGLEEARTGTAPTDRSGARSAEAALRQAGVA